jgi:dienelactone hydrolase
MRSRLSMLVLAALSAPGAITSAGMIMQSGPPRAAASAFDYDPRQPIDVKDVGVERRDGAVVRDITYAGVSGRRFAAYLVEPASGPRQSGILFAHWLENESPTANRTEFLPDAVELARHGVVSLLIETRWSDPEWFMSRKHADDYDETVQQVKDLRRAADLLFLQPGVQPGRAAYVGHDFGAMYGTLLGGVEKRFSAWVLMAMTTSFSDWFLYHPKLEGEARQRFIDEMAPLDPVRFVESLAPAPVLMQFATNDPHVPRARAEAYFAAAREPKDLRWYEAGHGLNDEAARDRIAWLTGRLGL